MRYIRLAAAALVVIALSACVGVIVPIPVSGSTTTDDTNRHERR